MSHPQWPLYVVDAFSAVPFAGNPAGVVFLPAGGFPSDATLQNIAAEMRHAETAFLSPRAELGGYDLRWFTPSSEVDLCGHATLGASHAIWERDPSAPAQLTFHTRSGSLTCGRENDEIRMDFPALAIRPSSPPGGLLEALAVLPAEVTASGSSPFDLFVELRTEQAVRALAPDLAAIAGFPVRGVIVAAEGVRDFDVVSRFFAPAVGVPEDPVTGSAHCALATHFAAKLGKPVLRCWQASPRGGEVRTELAGDRVILRGRAVTVVRGTILGGQ